MFSVVVWCPQIGPVPLAAGSMLSFAGTGLLNVVLVGHQFSWLWLAVKSLNRLVYEMFTKIMLRRMSVGRQLGRLLKLAFFFSLGVLLSISLSTLMLAPAIAQTTPNTIPNNASIQYDEPGSDGNTRIDQVSNTASYRLGAVAGVNNLGLGIVKSANKSAAEPGDVVIYTLLISNRSGNVSTVGLSVTDTFPLGVQYVPDSVAATLNNSPLTFDVNATNRQLTLDNFSSQLGPGEQLTVRYAATLSPDSVRGDGINRATADDIGGTLGSVSDQFQLTIRPGILSDCGTILGRVFVDNNFDGHQQSGEPGIPNAVIYMDSGNRIITDPNGLFSVANVISGNRVGVLDISSLNGYTLAPNLFRVEDNSQSRLVRLEPGGLVRMNFAVTPTFGEGE